MRYITGFVGGGYTNDFMTYVNIILLGQMTRRTAIIPPLSPSQHIGYHEVNVPFGDVFDLPRASEELRMHIIDWQDVKVMDRTKHANDPLGCWSAWGAFDPDGIPRQSELPGRIGLGTVELAICTSLP